MFHLMKICLLHSLLHREKRLVRIPQVERRTDAARVFFSLAFYTERSGRVIFKMHKLKKKDGFGKGVMV